MSKHSLCLLLMLPLVLSACAGDKNPPRGCPQVAILREVERVQDYGRETPTEANLVAVAQMNMIEGTCDYEDDNIDVAFSLSMMAGKGPRLGGNQTSFPYFVTVVSPTDRVVSKEIMTAQFEFSGDKTTAELKEDLNVMIPLAEHEDAAPYRVLMGFQLTEEQLQRVREQGD